MSDRGRRVFRALFVACLLLPGLVPVVAPYPPFQDWPGHAAAIGVLAHFDDPRANLGEFYELHGLWKPNALFYFLGLQATKFLPPLTAANLTLALALMSLGPAMWFLCRSAGADDRLALLSLPLAIGRHVYCGFAPNAAGLPLAMIALGCFFRLLREPRAVYAVTMAAALVLACWAHMFVFYAIGGTLALAGVIVWRSQRRASIATWIALASATAISTSMWTATEPVEGSATAAIWAAFLEADRSQLFTEWWAWLFASYRTRVIDDVLQAAWLAAVVALAFYGRSRLWSSISAIFAAGYLVLPSFIGPPLDWWGGNLRLPILAALAAIPAAGKNPPRRILLPAAALSVSIVILALVDLRRYSNQEMTGFAEVLAEIPPGRRISCLHYETPALEEYPGFPHGYLCGYYLLQTGGYAPFALFGSPYFPLRQKAVSAAPNWGVARGFDWYEHSAAYDGFIVRMKDGDPNAPFARTVIDKLQVIKTAGHWRYYSKYRVRSKTPMILR